VQQNRETLDSPGVNARESKVRAVVFGVDAARRARLLGGASDAESRLRARALRVIWSERVEASLGQSV